MKWYTLARVEAASEGGKSAEYREILVNDQVRVLTIDLEDDTSLVQIRGTQVVPEFDSVVMLSLVPAAIVGSFMALHRLRCPKTS